MVTSYSRGLLCKVVAIYYLLLLHLFSKPLQSRNHPTLVVQAQQSGKNHVGRHLLGSLGGLKETWNE
jgi:hypothetical protein